MKKLLRKICMAACFAASLYASDLQSRHAAEEEQSDTLISYQERKSKKKAIKGWRIRHDSLNTVLDSLSKRFIGKYLSRKRRKTKEAYDNTFRVAKDLSKHVREAQKYDFHFLIKDLRSNFISLSLYNLKYNLENNVSTGKIMNRSEVLHRSDFVENYAKELDNNPSLLNKRAVAGYLRIYEDIDLLNYDVSNSIGKFYKKLEKMSLDDFKTQEKAINIAKKFTIDLLEEQLWHVPSREEKIQLIKKIKGLKTKEGTEEIRKYMDFRNHLNDYN